jgi:hypothetical protein
MEQSKDYNTLLNELKTRRDNVLLRLVKEQVEQIRAVYETYQKEILFQFEAEEEKLRLDFGLETISQKMASMTPTRPKTLAKPEFKK